MWYICDDNGIRYEFDSFGAAQEMFLILLDGGEEDIWITCDE